MFAAPFRFFRPSVEYDLMIHIETLPLDKNLSLDSADLKSANFDPDPIELGDMITLHSYLDPLYREKSPIPRSPAARSPLRQTLAQCDQIGPKHTSSLEDGPIRGVECESASKVLGDVKGLKVLHVGCEVGRWSEWLVQNGAKEVVGVDNSEGLIEDAKEMQAGLSKELASKLNFQVKDWELPLTIEEYGFDLVLGAGYLFEASDHAELLSMFGNILTNLRPGGRFLGIVPDAFCPMHDTCSRTKMNEQAGEGLCRCISQCKPDDIAYRTAVSLHGLYEKAAQEAGMGPIKWSPYVLPKDQRGEKSLWDEFKLRPHLCLLECWKPA
ncbi:methyltransferase [Cercospora zeina]